MNAIVRVLEVFLWLVVGIILTLTSLAILVIALWFLFGKGNLFAFAGLIAIAALNIYVASQALAHYQSLSERDVVE